MREKSKLFFINGTILTITALLMQCASLIFGIYISNKIGSEAVGVFSLVMTVYVFFITISTSGLNIAVTVLVSEKMALKKERIAIKAIRSCILFSLIVGILAGLLVISCSDFIIQKCLHNMVTSKLLIYIAIGLPFISMSSCIQSYFSSVRKAYKNAITQVFEFIVKFIATVILLRLNINNGVEAICISLILADVISEVCSFTLIFIFYIFDVKIKRLNNVRSFGQRFNIVKIAFPVAITSYIRSGLSTIKQLIIPSQLEKFGSSYKTALSQYGTINGMVMPVINFPTVFIYSYSALLIPEFSTYVAQKNYKAINYVSGKIFKYTCAFSFCISSIFLCFSNDLGLLIYNDLEIGYYFKIFSPLIFLMYIDHIIDSVLKGLNKQFSVMCCNIIDLVITTCFIYFVLPLSGVKGYILSILLSELLNFSISLFQMIRYTGMKINFMDWFVVPLFCSIISFVFLQLFSFGFASFGFNVVANIALFAFVYFCCFKVWGFVNSIIKEPVI